MKDKLLSKYKYFYDSNKEVFSKKDATILPPSGAASQKDGESR